jgi:hypothetical protein
VGREDIVGDEMVLGFGGEVVTVRRRVGVREMGGRGGRV